MPSEDNLYSPDPNIFDTRFIGPKGADSKVEFYLIGEAPGGEEAEQGLPFVGRAGQFLNKMLTAAEADISKFRFFYSIPYRPIDAKKNNRTPTEEEIKFYSRFVSRHRRCQTKETLAGWWLSYDCIQYKNDRRRSKATAVPV
jgi:uracil-DNA glycosylase family 4